MTPPKSRAARIAPYAAAFAESDLTRMALSDGEFSFEFIRRAQAAAPKKSTPKIARPAETVAQPAAPAIPRETLRAEIVGTLRFVDPRPYAGLEFDFDRELFAVEALGVKTPVRSGGKGRIAEVLVNDGSPVEYGQPIAVIERV